MSLTVQQLLNDAKRLSGRLREHDTSADSLISSAQSVLKDIEAMRQYQEDIDSLNAVSHSRPRAQLVHGIQQENRHIRQLQNENKELKAALEERTNAIELIMSKYRQQVSALLRSTKLDYSTINERSSALLQDRADQICEMAGVMQESIKVDEEYQCKQQELLSRLVTENKGLREMLEISYRNGSYHDPLVGPKMVNQGCQTDQQLSSSSSVTPMSMSTLGLCCSSSKSHSSAENGIVPTNGLENSFRPLSSASEESEEISEDDEVIFNTIKRQAKKSSQVIENEPRLVDCGSSNGDESLVPSHNLLQ